MMYIFKDVLSLFIIVMINIMILFNFTEFFGTISTSLASIMDVTWLGVLVISIFKLIYAANKARTNLKSIFGSD